MELAERLGRLDWVGYTGERTPVYPLVILLCQYDSYIIAALQFALGVVLSLMLFSMLARRGSHLAVAVAVGLAPSLCLNTLFFEATILTESLASFFLVLATLLYARLPAPGSAAIRRHFSLGIVLSAAALTRPFFLLVLPVFFLFAAFRFRKSKQGLRGAMRPVALLSGAALTPVFIWSALVYAVAGTFAPTSLTGFNLTQHSVAFMEHADPDYAPLPEIYLRHRAQLIAEKGAHSMTIWSAYPEMLDATGLTFAQLSRRLTGMSIDLFARYPSLYAQTAWQGWKRFWSPTIYWMPDQLIYSVTQAPLKQLWKLQELALRNASLLFFVLIPTGAVWLRQRPSEEWLAVAVISAASIGQAMTELGENARYAAPFQPLLLMVVIVWSSALVSRAAKARTRMTASRSRKNE